MADTLSVTIDSNVAEVLGATPGELIDSTRRVIRQRISYLKTAVGREIRRAGLGERLAKALHAEVHDTPDGIVGEVIGRAKVKRASGTYDLIELFRSEQVIAVGGQQFLAIPLPAAGHGARGRKARVSDFGGGLVPKITGDTGVLVSPDNPETPLFILVKRVRISQRLNFSRIIAVAGKDLRERILRDWARTHVRHELRRVA